MTNLDIEDAIPFCFLDIFMQKEVKSGTYHHFLI